LHDEAELLEHVVSDRLIDRMDEMLGRPEADPHGDPIPDAEGVVKPQEAQTLLTCPLNTLVRVSRVLDQDKSFLRFIEGHDLKPGQSIQGGNARSGGGQRRGPRPERSPAHDRHASRVEAAGSRSADGDTQIARTCRCTKMPSRPAKFLDLSYQNLYLDLIKI
jgi:hypothetical protein